jgi:ribosomal-protein-alanine N-acetyltransferase
MLKEVALTLIDHQIRPALLSDLVAVCQIETDSFDQPYPRFLIDKLLRENSGRFFVASDRSGRLVGYCVASAKGRLAHLISVAVLRDQRRKGIGTGLLETLIRYLIEQHIEELWLEVKLSNQEAIALYTKLGFSRLSVVSNYYSDGAAALRMRLSLKGKPVD